MKATFSPRAKALIAGLVATLGIAMLPSPASAQTVIQDSFTGTQPQLDWLAYGNACMTAGNGATNSLGGKIPACTNITDTSGSGALRLTDAINNEAGAIVDQTPYSTASGLQITFTTYTYNGNSGGAAADGADGIGFYLLSSIYPTGTPGGTNPYQLGAFGGSLAYSCSNVNNSSGNSSISIPANHYNGMPSAYLGLGIDEYGNFLNAGDNTGTGSAANGTWGSSTSGSIASGSGPEYQPQRIGLRAWGNVTLTALQSVNSGATDSNVQSTCQNNGIYTGKTYTSTTSNSGNTATVGTYSYTVSSSITNYTYTSGNGNNAQTTTYYGYQTDTYGSASPINTVSTSVSSGTKLYSGSTCSSSTAYTTSGSSINLPPFGSNTNIYTKINNSCKQLTSSTNSNNKTAGGISTGTLSYGTTNTFNATSGAPSNTSSGGTLYATSSCSGNYSSGTAYGSVSIGSSGSNVCTSLTQSSSIYPWFPDYTAIVGGSAILPYTAGGTNNPIANESVSTRTKATPIAYKLTITPSPNSMLSLQYSYNGGSYQTILPPTAITTSNPALPSNLYFGFGGSTGGSNNVHEITCFQVTPSDQAASSAGVNVTQAGEVQTGTQVYLASYHTNNWWGQLTSQNLVVNNGVVSISSTYNWDASCVLTGGNCTSTGATGMTAEASRTLLTWNDSAASGETLTWGNLSNAEQAALNAGDSNGSNRLAFLTGTRTDEVPTSTGVATGAQVFRDRTSILGDIIDSSPTWVGAPNAPYSATWSDLLYPTNTAAENGTGAQTYPQFTTAEASRLNVVYDGSNDGFMHGFEAGSYNTDGTYNSANNDGKEVVAYMPASVVYSIHSTTATADYSSPNYSHEYYTDATPGTGDLFYSNKWHTWLVSGLGPGGNAIFALDITNPSNFSSNAGSTVIGEWDSSTLTCTNVATNCGANLGQTFGTPQIRRLHDGNWGIIFGNGLGSANGHAGIFVMVISSTGTESALYYLDTGVGSASNPDGIAFVTPTDMDGDHITDYVYAGDIYGNIWRFDLTSSTESNWAASTYGNATPTPLFTTPDITTTFTTSNGTTTSSTPTYSTPTTTQQKSLAFGSTTSGSTTTTITNQPITTQVVVVAVTPTNNGLPRVMVEFGTGNVVPQSVSSSIQYAGGQQTLYGVWDWDVGQAAPTTGYAGLIGSSSAPSAVINYSQLVTQSVTDQTNATTSGTGQGYRTLSSNAVCFAGTTCTTTSGTTTTTSTGTAFGWLLNLPGYNGLPSPGVGGVNQTEQVIYSPIETEGAFIVNTVVPANNSPTSCTVEAALGWTMALNPGTGGALAESFFANSSGQFVTLNNAAVGGIALNATGSPSVVTAAGLPFLVSQTSTGAGTVNPIQPPLGGKTQRLTWLQIN
ncbi:MAG TPA: PilC/PilY family type IV pilus protein [Dyella sp.]|uniref:PilC/PilY family type IV pilus protein n=1 Tax=Dyella sp. TaxID=1869338 RepID=UPI002CA8B41F|nr:PilC/PilY family type IV pilus protein [Dyella sp.]HTV85702.1 PilC/PilY family type IV pilus protein [Dyella sp.]